MFAATTAVPYGEKPGNKAPFGCNRQKISGLMFWWFERKGQHVRIEVLEVTTQHFELRMIDVDGAEKVETFSEAKALARRQEELQQLLYSKGWTGPHGWVI